MVRHFGRKFQVCVLQYKFLTRGEVSMLVPVLLPPPLAPASASCKGFASISMKKPASRAQVGWNLCAHPRAWHLEVRPHTVWHSSQTCPSEQPRCSRLSGGNIAVARSSNAFVPKKARTLAIAAGGTTARPRILLGTSTGSRATGSPKEILGSQNAHSTWHHWHHCEFFFMAPDEGIARLKAP